MDLQRGFTFPTRDPEWIVKVLIGTLISLVPIVNFAAIGYSMDVTRNVYHGRETPLPEWNDFVNQFIRGLLGVIIQILWMLPVFVIACPVIAMVAGATGAINTEEAAAGGGLVIACLVPLLVLGQLALLPFMLAALTRYAVTNQFSEALPGPVIREVRSNVRPWLTILGAFIGIGVVTLVLQLCTLGFGAFLLIPFSFYLQLMAAHWYAQAHGASVGGATAPPSMV